MFCYGVSFISDLFKCILGLQDDLLPESSELHGMCQLIHCDPIIQKSTGKIVVGIIRAISTNHVVGVHIDMKTFLQETDRLPCYRRFRPKQTM